MNNRSNHYKLSKNIVTARDHRDVVVVLYNDYFTNIKKYHEDYIYASELMKFTWSTTGNTLNQLYDFIMSDNLEEALVDAKQMGFKCAVVQTPGHVIRGDFMKNLNISRNQDWLLMGHILEDGNYLKLHDQCFVLNLDKLSIDDMDPGGPQKNVLVPMYERSPDNHHDEYTPLWVKFNQQYSEQNVKWGWKWISKGLINSQVIPFDNAMRNSKIHLYPENPGHRDTWLRRSENLTQMSKIIDQFDNFDYRKLHMFNNETVSNELIRHQTKQESFDNIVVLASGFYGLKTTKLFNARKIVYYDILQQMLDVTQRINEEWDGISDIVTFAPDHTVFNNSSLNRYDIYAEGIFKSQEELTEFLAYYRTIDKEYNQIDIISDPQSFLDIVPTSGSTYIWLDSVYTYWANLWKYRPRELEDSYQTIMAGLSEHDNDIWIHVKDPNGHIRILHNKNSELRFLDAIFSSNFRTWS